MMMRLHKDDLGLLTEVEWYRVPATRPVMPYFSPFRSGDWILREDQPILGEVAGTRKYFSGHVEDDLNGLGLCGSKDQWENGCSILDPIRPINPTTGQPCCCGPGSLPFSPDLVFQLGEGLTLVPRSPCTAAGDVPRYFRLQVFNPTNFACLDCANAGGQFTLESVESNYLGACVWNSGLRTVCGVQRYWELRSPWGGFPWQVYFHYYGTLPSLVVYNALGTFNPWGFNFLVKVSTDVACHFPNAVAINFLWEPL